jgi:gamma-glutamylputrescine oxidase
MTTSYWQSRMPPSKPTFDLTIKGKYDIIIVGAGITGTAIAHYLKKFGCNDILVLEKNYICYGASGRNAGFLLAGLAEPYSRLKAGLGPDSAREIMVSTIQNHDLMAEAISEKKINCDYKRTGSYHLAITEVERQELIETVDLLVQDGFKARFINTEAIDGLRGRDKFFGGFYNPIDGRLDPFAFVNGLADGIDIMTGIEVTSIERKDDVTSVRTSAMELKAEMVILATNAYTPLIDNYFKELIFPVRGQMLAVRPKEYAKFSESTFYANFGYDYFRNDGEEVILMGGLRDKFVNEEVGFDDKTTPNLQKGLEDYLKICLGIKQFDVINRWSGVMATTIDGLPLVGALPHNSSVLVAAGMNGHGFGLGMIIARDLAKAIVGEPTSDLLKKFALKRIIR